MLVSTGAGGLPSETLDGVRPGGTESLCDLEPVISLPESKPPSLLSLSGVAAAGIHVSTICIWVYLRQIFQIHGQHSPFNYFSELTAPSFSKKH